jgi:hypothetical protein
MAHHDIISFRTYQLMLGNYFFPLFSQSALQVCIQ